LGGVRWQGDPILGHVQGLQEVAQALRLSWRIAFFFPRTNAET
jgi:hypothetical protein